MDPFQKAKRRAEALLLALTLGGGLTLADSQTPVERHHFGDKPALAVGFIAGGRNPAFQFYVGPLFEGLFQLGGRIEDHAGHVADPFLLPVLFRAVFGGQGEEQDFLVGPFVTTASRTR